MIPRITVRIDARGAVQRLSSSLNDAMARALYLGAQDVAQDARRNHSFTNRTGRLERSIRANKPRGTFMANSLHVEIVANTPYAEFVENVTSGGIWAFLKPALRRMRGELGDRMGDALTRATRKAGW
jgi:hypothetical protein